jgi:hypothetical protein
VVRLKNKSSKCRDSEGKLKKVETPKPEHPETTEKPEEKDIHANHVEAFNSAIRRYLAAFVVVQILMLNLLWDYSES